MKKTFFVSLLAMLAVSSSFATQESLDQCSVLIVVQEGGTLDQMRQSSPTMHSRSCDAYLKDGRVEFGSAEFPSAPTKWYRSTLSWENSPPGQATAVIKEGSQTFKYEGALKTNTQNEFHFEGEDKNRKVKALFKVKRDKDGKVLFALYEYASRVSGHFRIGKE